MHLLLNTPQLWAVLLGAVVPAIGYTVNTALRINNEALRALTHIAGAAIVGALYTAASQPHIKATMVLQLIVSSVVGALLAHQLLWKPALLNLKIIKTVEKYLGIGVDAATPIR